MSLLAPAGTQAALTAELWWFMLALGLGVYAVVMALLALALWARTGGPLQISDSRRTGLIVVGGLAAPAAILLVLLTVDRHTLVAVPTSRPDLTVEVVGHQRWWEVRYPDHNVATANEVHVPVGGVVLLHLSSVDVIHSFWVPRLAGKMDVLPGQTTTTWLHATEPGEFRGECAEYCGIQHTRMTFLVTAQPDEAFQAWLAAQQQPAAAPADPTATSPRTAAPSSAASTRGMRAVLHPGTRVDLLAHLVRQKQHKEEGVRGERQRARGKGVGHETEGGKGVATSRVPASEGRIACPSRNAMAPVSDSPVNRYR